MKQIAILGLGRFGRALARTLVEMGHDVMGVDANEAVVEKMAPVLTNCVQADVMDEQTLLSLGVTNFDIVVVGIGNSDMQASIFTTLMLKEMGVEHVVCKVSSNKHARILLKLGADRVVYPERDMGMRFAHSIAQSDVLEFIELSEEYSMMEINAPKYLIGKSLKESDVRSKYNINIVAIKRGKKIMVNPSPDAVLEQGDVLLAIGETKALTKLHG
ncbi:MAG: TrkA family potassium uptake protein [Clostridiales bacterium]|nr:TrkA family potassium uptake protein [Clostridiales bacterium]